MSTKLNPAGVAHAHALVQAGKVNDGTWDFTAEDGNKLLGTNGDDWSNYGKWFLAMHPDATENTKAHYGYPFGKDGEIYKNAVVSAKGRAAQQGAAEVEAACSSLLDAMAGKKSTGVLRRAYSTIEFKSFEQASDGRTYFEGIASTPSPDRMGDIVEPMGAQFKLPMPFLYQHDAHQPIGLITDAKINSKGISVKGYVESVDGPPTLKERLDVARAEMKAGLVRGLSIGFSNLESEPIKGTYGLRFTKWDWMELSAVTIPANAEASIQTVKSIDARHLAASGKKAVGVVSMSAGVSAKSIKAQEAKSMNIQDQIKQYETTRGTKAAELTELVEKSGDAGHTFDAEQSDRFKELEGEIKTIDTHLARLRTTESLLASKAKPVTQHAEDAATVAVKDRDPNRSSVVAVEEKLDKGIGFGRFVRLMAINNGNARDAYDQAKQVYPEYRPLHEAIKAHIGQGQSRRLIEKTTVDAALTSNSSWAGSLVQYQILANDFIEYLRPQTIIGKINGFRRVPFKVKVPRQTGGGSASWVGEGKAKPLTSLAFDTVSLDFTKIASIAVLTDEVLRLSSPSADAITRDQLAQAIINQMDSDFIDPANSGSSNVKPASVTNGATTAVATGTTTQAGIASDVLNLFAPWLDANVDPSTGVWIMSPTTAMALSLMQNSLGQPIYPGMTVNGGNFSGLPVVVSNAAGMVGASDGSHIVVLLNPRDVLLADDGTVAVDASREASLEMSDAPASSAATGQGASLVSMFQTNSVALRAERWINWVKARTTAASYLTAVHWGGFPS